MTDDVVKAERLWGRECSRHTWRFSSIAAIGVQNRQVCRRLYELITVFERVAFWNKNWLVVITAISVFFMLPSFFLEERILADLRLICWNPKNTSKLENANRYTRLCKFVAQSEKAKTNISRSIKRRKPIRNCA